MEEILTAGLLFGVGLTAGFVDAIAGGGGLITVPALLWAGLPPAVALGTNKLQSSCGTTVAVWNYSRAGLIAWRRLLLPLVLAFLSAMAGSWAVSLVPRDLLRRCLPILLGCVAVYTWRQPSLGRVARPAWGSWTLGLPVAAVALGFYDGFLGPGTGSFWTLVLVVGFGLELSSATGTTKALNLASNLGSLILFASRGLIDIRFGFMMAAGQLVGARLGSGLVIRRGADLIRPVFLTVVIALTAKLLWDVLGH
ncbi:MAG: hypothetical protein EXS36_07740 [Pedosphaera sp.]|nr:hypothetical protein [Pedosphaera sp.]